MEGVMLDVRSAVPRRLARRALVITGLCALMSSGSAVAAVNAYLLVDGIEGGSTSLAHAIDIYSFSQGVSRVVAAATAGAGGAKQGKISCSDLTILKQVDVASIPLIQAAFTGQIIPHVTLIYDKPVGDKQQTYFTITLSNAIITSVQESGSNENPTESVSFNATTFAYSFSPEKDDGTLDKPLTFTGSCSG
jgi:type VI secretion system secreted protein Hcp